MTKKVAGTSLSAPAIPAAANGAPNDAAVEAATIPRGSIQPMNARSRTDSGVRSVETAATSGRTITTSPRRSSNVGPSTARTEDGVTVAEMEMNSTPMTSWTIVRKNFLSSGKSMPGRLANATPITMAAIRPVSARQASQSAAVPTTTARIASVAITPLRRSLLKRSHSTAAPTTPPSAPTPMLRKKARISRPCPVCVWLTMA